MNFTSNSYSNANENMSSEPRQLSSEKIKDFNNNSETYHKNTTLASLSGNSTSNDSEKNKFYNHLGKNFNKNIYDTRLKIIEKIKNKYTCKNSNGKIKEQIVKNNLDQPNLIDNYDSSFKNNYNNILKIKNKQDENIWKMNIKSKKYNENNSNLSDDNNNENNNNENQNIKKENNFNSLKKSDKIINNNNKVITQFNSIFPKDSNDKKILEQLNEVTEEKTENYISIEKEKEKENNKLKDLKKEKPNINLNNMETNKSIEMNLIDNKKDNINNSNNKEKEKLNEKIIKRKKKYLIPENIKSDKIVPIYKFISSLNELDSFSDEEKIQKLFEINLNLYQELIDTKTKNNMLIEELKRKEEEKDDKFNGYLLNENEKLIEKNKENERIIDYLLKKLNLQIQKKNKINRNIFYDDIKNEIKIRPKSNRRKNNYTDILDYNINNLSNSNNFSNTKSISISKNLTSFNSLSPQNTLNDFRNSKIKFTKKTLNKKSEYEKDISYINNNEFFDYYGKNGIDRIKTCYACLFGKSNYTKGYSPIVCSPHYINN